MREHSTDWTVLTMLEWATNYFKEKGLRNPRLSIEWLLAYVLQKKRLDLYLLFDRPLTSEELESIRPLIKRRAKHEPLQYITGETDFFGYPIKVEPCVLIPRPETEELVERVLEKLSYPKGLAVLDIGTGSGCIPISLKKNRPGWNLKAIDISLEAIQLAKENALLNAVEIDFFVEDLFSPSKHLLSNRFDIIISNPPYVLESEANTLDREVREFEPGLALFTLSTKKVYQSIEQLATKLLIKNGLLFLEINERFGTEILQFFSTDLWEATLQKDHARKDRFIIAKKVQ